LAKPGRLSKWGEFHDVNELAGCEPEQDNFACSRFCRAFGLAMLFDGTDTDMDDEKE
jgi:hypothetical protein